MTAHAGEHERTIAFAELALGQIKSLRYSATPRNYEIWYTYAAGYNSALNQTINDMRQHGGIRSDADLDKIYETHLSSTRLSERIDTVGSQVKDEIEQMMVMVEAAAGSANSYTESLHDMGEKLGQSMDRDSVRAIVESLVQTAREMEASNKNLENRLHASMREISELQANLEAARTESLTDPLTQLSNRKFFDIALEREITDSYNRSEPLSLMLMDVDHFKKFNDNFGHLTGDQVLRLVAASVKQNVKDQDTAARYGGEEFAVILPNTALPSALAIADQIRRAVMKRELVKRSTGENLGRVTISMGIAILQPTDNIHTLLERADECLYAAKRHGRNRVISEIDPEMAQPAQVA